MQALPNKVTQWGCGWRWHCGLFSQTQLSKVPTLYLMEPVEPKLCCFILTVSVAYSHPSAIYLPISESWQSAHDEHRESPTQGSPPFCSVSF